MPKIRRQNIPPTLLDPLLDRIRSREISADQLGLFAEWLDTEPEVPNEKWFKRFPQMIVCGEDDLVKTFLNAQQLPIRKGSFLTDYLCIVSRLRSITTCPVDAATRTRRGEGGKDSTLDVAKAIAEYATS
jgi:hypothetical protein